MSYDSKFHENRASRLTVIAREAWKRPPFWNGREITKPYTYNLLSLWTKSTLVSNCMTIGKAFNRETNTWTKFRTLKLKQRTRFVCSMNIYFITWSGRSLRVWAPVYLIPLLETFHSTSSVYSYTLSLNFPHPKNYYILRRADKP